MEITLQSTKLWTLKTSLTKNKSLKEFKALVQTRPKSLNKKGNKGTVASQECLRQSLILQTFPKFI